VYAFVIFNYHRHWNALKTFEGSEPVKEIRTSQVDNDSSFLKIINSDTINSVNASQENIPLISVIIAARNEEKSLPALIDSLIVQSFRDFEVIIINDHSTDETEKVLQQITDNRFHYINLSDHIIDTISAYKKKAIETGINFSKGELIVTTDADCIVGTNWLAVISAFYRQTGAHCIAAPVKIDPGKSLLGLFQSIDFCTLQGITAAAVSSRTHMMCNGANFIYTRNAFNEVRGFQGIDHIPSGDDMLLMQKIFDKYPDKVFYLKSGYAIVTTQAATNWKEFFNQRIRWASKSTDYTDKKIFYILMVVYFYNLLFPVLALTMFWYEKGWMMLVLFMLFKLLVEFPFVASVAKFFGLSKLMWYFPFLQPLHIIYTVIAGWLGKFGSYQWKNRKVKTAPN
jgi:cellulose synthase/poly-beta-1,6-N-acetylglucosamine synthase-like glycosyltransferase